MSFSKGIKEDVLVACRRRCVLCGKFCGLNIELHHIVPHSKGGEDTFDNCIPLCFDHHAEVGQAYYVEHPKGTKYTEHELKRTRNKFYEQIIDNKISNTISEGLSVNYEKALHVLKFLYEKCLEKNVLGVIIGYNAVLWSYDSLCEKFNKEGISIAVFNELLAELEQKHMITTNLRKDKDDKISGSIKINIEGVSFYEEETKR